MTNSSQYNTGSLVAALPSVRSIGLSDEDVSVMVFHTQGPEKFREFTESDGVDIDIDGAHVDVPWAVYDGSTNTSMLSFIVATGAYTAEELIAKYKKSNLKKAATTILKNPIRFGTRVSYGWNLAKKIGMSLDNYLSSSRAEKLVCQSLLLANRTLTDGRGQLLVDMVIELSASIDNSSKLAAISKFNIEETEYLISHYGIIPETCSGLLYQAGTALWLANKHNVACRSAGLMIKEVDADSQVVVPAIVDNPEEYIRWGRMCIEKYGVESVCHSREIPQEVVSDYFYGVKHHVDDTI